MSVQTQLKRLKRHYEQCVKSYDYIGLLDLSHTLRVLGEMTEEIDDSSDKVFKIIKPSKKFTRLLKRSLHIYMRIPEAVTTYAVDSKGDMRPQFFFPKEWQGYSDYKMFGVFKTGETPNEIKFYNICLHNRLTSEEEKRLEEYEKRSTIEKLKFSHYIKRPFIYFKMKRHDPTHITREQLIKRLANEYDASHPGKKNHQSKNKFSGPVREFMNIKLANLPMPYFAILHIAKDIIENVSIEE